MKLTNKKLNIFNEKQRERMREKKGKTEEKEHI